MGGAMAATIESPRPSPSWTPRSGSSRQNGSNRPATTCDGTAGPDGLDTTSTAPPAEGATRTSTSPPGTLWRTALSTRFVTRRPKRRESPMTATGDRTGRTRTAACRAAASPSRSTSETVAARSTRSVLSRPRSLRARVRRASLRFSSHPPASSRRSSARRSAPAAALSSARATSPMARCSVSGVRRSGAPFEIPAAAASPSRHGRTAAAGSRAFLPRAGLAGATSASLSSAAGRLRRPRLRRSLGRRGRIRVVPHCRRRADPRWRADTVRRYWRRTPLAASPGTNAMAVSAPTATLS